MVKIGGSKNSAKKLKLNGNRGKFINFAEIGRISFINFVEIGGIYNMHH